MKEELRQKLTENFDEKNIESISKLIEEPIPEMVGMFVDESGNGKDVKITEESRKICAASLLK